MGIREGDYMYNRAEIQSKVTSIAGVMPISKVILVGSYAKGAATEESDIDLIVDGEDLSELYWDFLFELEDTFSVKIDLMTLRGLRNSCISDNILSGGIVLYEK